MESLSDLKSRQRRNSKLPIPSLLNLVSATFERPSSGYRWRPGIPTPYPVDGAPAWQSNGGPRRNHPARSLPFSFTAAVPDREGDLRRVTLFGVFALYAGRENQAIGAVGASVQLLSGGEVAHRQDLLNGRHYRDAQDLMPWEGVLTEGYKLETVGTTVIEGKTARVDKLTIDVPSGVCPDQIRFKSLGTSASFVIFEVFLEFYPSAGCPFRSSSGGIALGDLAAIVRVGDRVRFNRALEQLISAIEQVDSLDEARGMALTFLAIVTAGTLEMGGTREMHLVQLEAARTLDDLNLLDEIVVATRELINRVSAPLFGPKAGPSARLVDRALNLVERNYAKQLSDSSVAEQLGLSTSHFRFLFKQATGQPFHKYLVAVRLEKARRMLLTDSVPVSTVAASVGFSGLAHFSRAFSQRFHVSPTSIRRSPLEVDD